MNRNLHFSSRISVNRIHANLGLFAIKGGSSRKDLVSTNVKYKRLMEPLKETLKVGNAINVCEMLDRGKPL